MAALGIPMLLGPIGGPILGGFLIEQLSWHWIFLINLPIGIIAPVYAWFVLDKNYEPTRANVDVLGLVLLSPVWRCSCSGCRAAPRRAPRLDPRAGARGYRPGADRRVRRTRATHRQAAARPAPVHQCHLRNALITMSMFAIAFFGSTLLFPQYFIGVRGEGTMMAGLLLAPQGIGAMVTMPVAGRLTDKMGPGKFVLVGITLIFAGLTLLMFLGADTSYWLIGSALFVQGLGMGMTMTLIMTSALAKLRPTDVPHGSTLLNVTQQTSSSIGTALFSVLLATNLSSHKESGLAIPRTPPKGLRRTRRQGRPAATTAAAVVRLGGVGVRDDVHRRLRPRRAHADPGLLLPRTRITPAEDAPPMIAH